MIGAIDTGVGVWNALVWLIIMVPLILTVYLFYRFGESEYKRDNDQVQPFLSGNFGEDEDIQVKFSNVYWGFITALDSYYKPLKSIHTGIVNDYVSWLVIVCVISLILITIAGVIA